MEHTRVGVAFARWNFLLFIGLQIIKISSGKYTVTRVLQMNPPLIVGFTLEAKLVSSKHLIQVHLEILSRSVENMASHLSIQRYSILLVIKAINLSIHSNLGTAARAHRAHGFHFSLVKCVLKCGVDHT